MSDLVKRLRQSAMHECNCNLCDRQREAADEIENLTKQRNGLLLESDAFQCDIASALGWEADGKPFIEYVRELWISYWQPTN